MTTQPAAQIGHVLFPWEHATDIKQSIGTLQSLVVYGEGCQVFGVTKPEHVALGVDAVKEALLLGRILQSCVLKCPLTRC